MAIQWEVSAVMVKEMFGPRKDSVYAEYESTARESARALVSETK